eukprot:12925848-Alexandrium_andersonii.AAC.1
MEPAKSLQAFGTLIARPCERPHIPPHDAVSGSLALAKAVLYFDRCVLGAAPFLVAEVRLAHDAVDLLGGPSRLAEGGARFALGGLLA